MDAILAILIQYWFSFPPRYSGMEGTTCSFGSFILRVVRISISQGGPCGNYDIHHEGGQKPGMKWLAMCRLQSFGRSCHDILWLLDISRASAPQLKFFCSSSGSQIACRKGRRPCAKRRSVEMLVKRVPWGVVAQWQNADSVARWKITI